MRACERDGTENSARREGSFSDGSFISCSVYIAGVPTAVARNGGETAASVCCVGEKI